MKRITELHNFRKFWKLFNAHNRNISDWDERRTDQAVFIDRTLCKWFAGKCFEVDIDRHSEPIYYPTFKQPTEYMTITKYVSILSIRLAYSAGQDVITIRYFEPHSEKMEEVQWGLYNFESSYLRENEGDFRLLKRFYPVAVKKYPKIDFSQFNIEKPKRGRPSKKENSK